MPLNLAGAGHHLGHDAAPLALRDLLPQVADREVASPRHGARVRRLVAGDDLEQRRLAGPVRPDDRHAAAGADLQADVAEQVLGGVALRHAREGHEAHGPPMVAGERVGGRGRAGRLVRRLQTRSGRVEPQPRRPSGWAGCDPRLLDGVRNGGSQIREHHRPGPKARAAAPRSRARSISSRARGTWDAVRLVQLVDHRRAEEAGVGGRDGRRQERVRPAWRGGGGMRPSREGRPACLLVRTSNCR